MAITCKHCGKDFKSPGYCSLAPERKHEGVPNGKHCINCGKKYNREYCGHSSDRKHHLA